MALQNVLAFLKLTPKEQTSHAKIFIAFFILFLAFTQLYGSFCRRFATPQLSFLTNFTKHVAQQRLSIWPHEFIRLQSMASQLFTFLSQLQILSQVIPFLDHSKILLLF